MPARHCSALTKAGNPCPNSPVRASDPPLCISHAPRPLPRRRCTALNQDGNRCRGPALRPDPHASGEDPRLCVVHAGRFKTHTPTDARRCTALTKAGTPCRNKAVNGSDPPLCIAHSGQRSIRPTERDRCTAFTKSGVRCRSKAMHATVDSPNGPPLCRVHGKSRYYAPSPDRRCTARNLDGSRCRHWAKGGSDPPRCTTHLGLAGFQPGNTLPWKHGLYSRRTPLENWLHELFPVVEDFLRTLRIAPPDYFDRPEYAAAIAPILHYLLIYCRLGIADLTAETKGPDIPFWKVVRYARLVIRASLLVSKLLNARLDHRHRWTEYVAFLEPMLAALVDEGDPAAQQALTRYRRDSAAGQQATAESIAAMMAALDMLLPDGDRPDEAEAAPDP